MPVLLERNEVFMNGKMTRYHIYRRTSFYTIPCQSYFITFCMYNKVILHTFK